ncbi:MAG: hypothetical protein FD175_486 [Beijerinckiaceae bacterium]|nr:MAG: hypothetical protein FD175_486 [Beijerinckiaceae bacterium]
MSLDPNADKFKIELSKFMTPEMPVFEELRGCIFDRL